MTSPLSPRRLGGCCLPAGTLRHRRTNTRSGRCLGSSQEGSRSRAGDQGPGHTPRLERKNRMDNLLFFFFFFFGGGGGGGGAIALGYTEL